MNVKKLFERHSAPPPPRVHNFGRIMNETGFIAALSEALCCGPVIKLIDEMIEKNIENRNIHSLKINPYLRASYEDKTQILEELKQRIKDNNLSV